jgi:hypothetical protein
MQIVMTSRATRVNAVRLRFVDTDSSIRAEWATRLRRVDAKNATRVYKIGRVARQSPLDASHSTEASTS